MTPSRNNFRDPRTMTNRSGTFLMLLVVIVALGILIYLTVRVFGETKEDVPAQVEAGIPYKIEILGGKKEVAVENVCRHEVTSGGILATYHCGRIGVRSQLYLNLKGEGFRVMENIPTDERCKAAAEAAIDKLYRANSILYNLRDSLREIDYGLEQESSKVLWELWDTLDILKHPDKGGE